MKWMVLGAAFVTAIAAHAPVVQAEMITFTTTLSGAIEATPNLSPGTGTATVTIDDVLNEMRVQVSFSNLVGETGTSVSTNAHIHCCTEIPFDVTDTAIVATVTPTFPDFPSGVTSGTYDRTFELLPFTPTNTYNAAFVTAHGGTVTGAAAALIAGLEAGTAYLNIHSVEFPGGEIRGFLSQVPNEVPEPSSLLLLAAAFGGMLPFIRRRYSADRA
jgi:hypothetical protein